MLLHPPTVILKFTNGMVLYIWVSSCYSLLYQPQQSDLYNSMLLNHETKNVPHPACFILSYTCGTGLVAPCSSSTFPYHLGSFLRIGYVYKWHPPAHPLSSLPRYLHCTVHGQLTAPDLPRHPVDQRNGGYIWRNCLFSKVQARYICQYCSLYDAVYLCAFYIVFRMYFIYSFR